MPTKKRLLEKELAFQAEQRFPGPAARPGARRPVPRQRAVRATGASPGWSTSISPASTACLRRRGVRERLVPGEGSVCAGRAARRARCSRAYHARAAVHARSSARPGRRCCAQRRCASGFRACTTSTCRARACWCTRTTRSISAACSSRASRAPGAPGAPRCRRASSRRRGARAGWPTAGACSARRRSAGSRWCSPTGCSMTLVCAGAAWSASSRRSVARARVLGRVHGRGARRVARRAARARLLFDGFRARAARADRARRGLPRLRRARSSPPPRSPTTAALRAGCSTGRRPAEELQTGDFLAPLPSPRALHAGDDDVLVRAAARRLACDRRRPRRCSSASSPA